MERLIKVNDARLREVLVQYNEKHLPEMEPVAKEIEELSNEMSKLEERQKEIVERLNEINDGEYARIAANGQEIRNKMKEIATELVSDLKEFEIVQSAELAEIIEPEDTSGDCVIKVFDELEFNIERVKKFLTEKKEKEANK